MAAVKKVKGKGPQKSPMAPERVIESNLPAIIQWLKQVESIKDIIMRGAA